jgi:hypothetical protein
MDVDYFLVDARDIAPQAWGDCDEDGTRGCPYSISSFPYERTDDTTNATQVEFPEYNCSTADEAGPEQVYVLTVDATGILTADVLEEEGVDVDVHLLDGDDPDACLTRGNYGLEAEVTPGRYWLVVDSWSDGDQDYAGGYTLSVDFQD